MEFVASEQGKWAEGPPSKPVWPEVVDVVGLSLSELRARLGLIKRSEARLAAMKTAALAEYSSRDVEDLARRVVLDELQASKQQGRREVETAGQFSRVPETLDPPIFDRATSNRSFRWPEGGRLGLTEAVSIASIEAH